MNMQKRFYMESDSDGNQIIKDQTNDLIVIRDLQDATYMLNKLSEEYDFLTHALIDASKDNVGTWRTVDKPYKKLIYGCDPK